jgi:hypothetical protein
VLLPLLRQNTTRSWDTISAEDGWLYFQQAHDHGLAVLFRGYAGYVQLPTRLLAAPSTLVPVSGLAVYFALVSSVFCALLACFVFWASDGWVRSRAARLALASLVVLMPALGQENSANLTNTIWMLAAVAPWAFAARSERSRAVALRSAIVFFAAMATLVSIVFVPLAVGLVGLRRSAGAWIVSSAYFAGLALQLVASAYSRDQRRLVVRNVADVPEIIAVRAFAQYLVGDRGIQAVWTVRPLLVVVAPVLVLGILLAASIGVGRRRQVLALAFIGVGVAGLLLPVWGRGTGATAIAIPATTIFGPHPRAGQYDPLSARFSVIPVMMIASAAAVLFTSPRTSRPWLSRALTAAFVTQVVAVVAIGFPVTNARSPGPAWSDTVETQRVRCATLDPAAKVQLRVPGSSINPAVLLPCSDL